MTRRTARQRVAPTLLAFVLGGCSQLVQYTDELSDDRTGRSALVTTPATIGGVVGFVAGVPIDVVALPVTYLVYQVQKSEDPLGTGSDPLSTMLFPSFVCWRVGKLIAVPFDLAEFLVWRVWRSEKTLTRQEREAIEVEHDARILPSYPVQPIYPIEEFERRARQQS